MVYWKIPLMWAEYARARPANAGATSPLRIITISEVVRATATETQNFFSRSCESVLN